MTNIALSSPHAIFATRLSPHAVHSKQTAGSALSHTYSYSMLYCKHILFQWHLLVSIVYLVFVRRLTKTQVAELANLYL